MNKKLLVVVAVAAAGLIAWNVFFQPTVDIRFGPDKMDFARLEHEYPLETEDLLKITPQNLKGLSQEHVDQIYGRLPAGPIPDGAYEGDLFFARGVDGNSRLAEILGGGVAGGLKGFAANMTVTKLEILGRTIWKGKVFYRDERLLRNRIEDLRLLEPLLGNDTGGIQKLTVNGRDAWLLFPAKLYCGQSLLDGRRESIIIDYAFTDELPGYREKPDFLAGRNGLNIRDEIRMVRPGFYLGRAYMNRVFALNFTLYNEEVASKQADDFIKTGKTTQDCWAGFQRAAAATR